MPATIGALVLSTLGVTEIAGMAITAGTIATVGNITIIGSLLAANYLMRPDPPKPSDGQVTTRQPLPPRRRNYGRVKVGGAIMFSEVYDGKLYEVVAINQGEIDAFEEHWLGDIQVTLDGSGNAVPIDSGNDAFVNKGRKYVQIFYELGTDEDLGFPNLHAIFPTLWDADHCGRGVAKALVISTQPDSRDYSQVFPAGRPLYRAVIRASKVWDPRDVTQNKDDKATWKWSQNPVLHALDYHRHRDGMRLAPADNILFTPAALNEDWIPAADICDEAMPLKAGGTEPRYLCSGGYPLPAAPKDVLPPIMNTCQGQVFMRLDGAIGMRVGKVVAPSLIFDADEKHILAYTGFRTGDDLFLVANEITAKFTGPEYDYQDTDVTPWRNEADITARGQVLSSDIDLSWVPSYSQARRLMKIEYHRKNPAWVGQFDSDLFALNGFGERYLRLTLSDLEIAGLDFEITSFGINPANAVCSLGVSAFDGSTAYAWNPEVDEGDPPPVPVLTSGGGSIAPPDAVTATLATRQISTGTNGVVLVIGWDAPTRVDLVAQAQYKLHSAADWLPASVSTDNVSAETPILQDGATYDVRVQFMTGTRTSDWTELDSILVGAPADPPSNFTAVGASPSANLEWDNSSSPNLAKVRIYRNSTNNFATATSIAAVSVTPSTHTTSGDTPFAGAWWYWIVSETAAGIKSAPVGPQTVTV